MSADNCPHGTGCVRTCRECLTAPVATLDLASLRTMARRLDRVDRLEADSARLDEALALLERWAKSQWRDFLQSTKSDLQRETEAFLKEPAQPSDPANPNEIFA